RGRQYGREGHGQKFSSDWRSLRASGMRRREFCRSRSLSRCSGAARKSLELSAILSFSCSCSHPDASIATPPIREAGLERLLELSFAGSSVSRTPFLSHTAGCYDSRGLGPPVLFPLPECLGP